MSPMKRRLIEDRAMRDEARGVVRAQVAWFKAGAGEPGFANHVIATASDYAHTVADGAAEFVHDNKGKLSGGVAVAALGLAAFLFRDRLGDLVQGMIDGLTGDDETDGADEDGADETAIRTEQET
ncbi:hypothetical protein [Alteraurantiacibacter buctensis]|uniref:Uncharacterized protein n=1 Tax=Alteraurantiacibacter buctensis TaxID=1503981 RepID=A0A844YY63_9SPHN|nr:hypothetical protein [Alteraurantiacibacter buctensis]MXO71721.1 hypothetical protein [Alteraurantiacibacter buctensis]